MKLLRMPYEAIFDLHGRFLSQSRRDEIFVELVPTREISSAHLWAAAMSLLTELRVQASSLCYKYFVLRDSNNYLRLMFCQTCHLLRASFNL
jgi:hypothetical protein